MRHVLIACLCLFMVALPPRVLATQEAPELDRLFTELQALDKRRDQRAGELQARIWHLWYEHDDAEVTGIMEAGLRALAEARYREAVDAFTQVIELDPDYAEAWNRRATAYYLLESYQQSLADIERVLELEPRHFGALSGRGLCLRQLGRPRAALQAFERALEVNPHLDNIYVEIIRLRARMDGSPENGQPE